MVIKSKINPGSVEKEFKEFGGYWLGGTFSAGEEIKNIADSYKRQYIGRMIPVNSDELDPLSKSKYKKKMPNDVIASVKVDGEYNVCVYEKDEIPFSLFCNSPNGRVRYNLPVNHDIENLIQKKNADLSQLKKIFVKHKVDIGSTIETLSMAGELCAGIKKDHDRPRVFDVIHLSRNPQSQGDVDKIHFVVFDIISINGIDLLDLQYDVRMKIVEDI